jgi:hypothetical protein
MRSFMADMRLLASCGDERETQGEWRRVLIEGQEDLPSFFGSEVQAVQRVAHAVDARSDGFHDVALHWQVKRAAIRIDGVAI